MDALDAAALTQKLYARLNTRRPEIEKAEKYLSGKQPLTFATEEWKKQNASRYDGFADNWCAPVVNAMSERISIAGITDFGTKSRAKSYWDDLRRNQFELGFSQATVTTLAARRSYVIVWGDADGQPVVSFEHPSMVEIQYDWENPDRRTAAIKSWMDETHEYATLYTPSEVFKWERERTTTKPAQKSQVELMAPASAASDGGWVPRKSAGDDWVIPNPMGVVPVVEWSNRRPLLGDPISEIQGVIPMQDFINLLWAYLMLSADYASMDARVILGADPPKTPILDEDGKVVGERPVDMKDLREKRLINITGEDAKIDSWKAAALDVFTSAIENAVGHIAAQTRTPPHYLIANKGMSQLSGDAVKALEAGLVSKVRDFARYADASLREVLRLMAIVKGDAKAAGAALLAQFHWDKVEIRSDAQMADALLKKSQIGYPFEYLLEEEGKSPSQIKRILEMREAELYDPQLAAALRPVGGLNDPEGIVPAV